MTCLHPISWINGWIFTKLVHLYCWDMEKNWLDFGDLVPILQGHRRARVVGKWIVCTLSPEWMDGFWLTCTSILLWHGTELIDFGDLDPILKVTQGLRLLENRLSAPYLMKKGMDFDQSCTTILLWHEKYLIRFLVTLTLFSRSHKGSDCWKMAFLHPISRMNGWVLTRQELIRFL